MKPRTLLAVASLALAAAAFLSPAGLATPPPNTGTVKVHDNATADPEVRNEPHVTCTFWIEGFNMSDDQGGLVFYAWPPTGDKSIVLTARWSGEEMDNHAGFHFLAGPFTLADGHYRLEAFADAGHPGDQQHFAKAKEFWVDPCVVTPPPCGTPGAEQCPPIPCGQPGGDVCPPIPCGQPGGDVCPPIPCGQPGGDVCPPIPCGQPGGDVCPPIPCGQPGGQACPPTTCGTEGNPACPPELLCPTDLRAVGLSGGRVLVSFTPSAGSDATNVYRADGDQDFHLVGTVTDGTTFEDTTTVAGSTYTYKVTAVSGANESQGCMTVEVTAIPDFPTPVAFGAASGAGLLAYAWWGRRK